ncbi:MAG: hypothetical protein JSS27_17980 [Planctomycetes bacterium]|nr:hypothetical protein [Planctomycetota bacterium]
MFVVLLQMLGVACMQTLIGFLLVRQQVLYGTGLRNELIVLGPPLVGIVVDTLLLLRAKAFPTSATGLTMALILSAVISSAALYVAMFFAFNTYGS